MWSIIKVKNIDFVWSNEMIIRTDLALERHEMLGYEQVKGVRYETKQQDEAKVTLVEVLDEDGEKQVGKPKGKYYTVDVPEFSHETELLDGRLKAITNVIREMLPQGEISVLVVGIGNDNITPDALGPLCAEQIFSTRHIETNISEELGLPKFNPVASISTGVLGQTGIETAEYIKGIVDLIKPKTVIAIDALASRKLFRLGKTVQLSDTGISPGAGIGNNRAKIDENLLGVPVIAIGIPTVVDGRTMVYDLVESDLKADNISTEAESVMVTPKDIDMIIKRASRLLALSINCALQPHIEPEFLLSLM